MIFFLCVYFELRNQNRTSEVHDSVFTFEVYLNILSIRLEITLSVLLAYLTYNLQQRSCYTNTIQQILSFFLNTLLRKKQMLFTVK